MFFNHDKQAVFIHIPKTGGSSLLNILDGGSPVWPHYEGFKHNQEASKRWVYPYGQHAKFCHVKGADKKLYRQIKPYYKFSIIRNPWAHAVSRYFYDTHINHLDHTLTWEKGLIPLDRTIKRFDLYLKDVYQSQDWQVFEDGTAYEDVEFFKLEEMKDSINTIMIDRLGYEFDGVMPHDNKNKDAYTQAWGLEYPNHYSDFYTNQQCIDIVAQRSKTVIDRFNYTFDLPAINLFELVEKE